ncbi:hypothetical protein Ate01nite_25380 [Actinoplanes teichomyceticus]|nr:hypothetical protein Ate01nite_25380 [Actinoplanes teichomyceticus]
MTRPGSGTAGAHGCRPSRSPATFRALPGRFPGAPRPLPGRSPAASGRCRAASGTGEYGRVGPAAGRLGIMEADMAGREGTG